MTKYEYLAELERLLSALPEQERRDAMNYYEEYFVSAGPEKEAEAIHELGTPQQVARKILEEAGVNPGDQATGNPIYAAAQPSGRRKLSTPMIVLLVVVAVLVVVPIIAGLLGGLAFGSFTAQTAAAVESEPVAGSSGGSAESLPQPTAGSGTAETASNGTVSLGADLRKLEIDIYNVDLTVEVDPGVAGPVVSAPELPQDQVVVRRESDGEVKLYLGNRDDLRNQGTLIPVPATLTLPADVSTKDMDFELYAGSVSIPDLTLQELDISVNAGVVTLGAMEAQSIDIETNAGSVVATALTANEVDLGTNAGSIEVESGTAGSAGMETNAGGITVNRLEASREGEFDVRAGTMQVGLAGQETEYNLIADITGGSLNYGAQTYWNTEIRGQGTGMITLEIDVAAGDATFSFVG